MKKINHMLIGFLSWVAFTGNILFVLWILVNGIKENFSGTTVEKISYIALITLLIVNAILIFNNRAGRNH